MTEPVNVQSSESQNATKAGSEEKPTLTIDDLQKQLDQIKAANAELKKVNDSLLDKDREHGKEMQRKKEREREALEKEKAALAQKGEYEKLLELSKTEMEDLRREREQFHADRQNWTKQQKRFAVMTELMRPGVLNPKVKPEDAAVYLDIEKIELDEQGRPKAWDDVKKSLYDGRQWLLPSQTQPLGTPEPAGGANGSPNARAINEIAADAGVSPEIVASLLKDDKVMKKMREIGIKI